METRPDVVITDAFTTMIQCVHAVCFSKTRTEHTFHARNLLCQRLIFFLVIASPYDNALYATRLQGLYTTQHHRAIASRNKTFWNIFCHGTKPSAHACRHYYSRLYHHSINLGNYHLSFLQESHHSLFVLHRCGSWASQILSSSLFHFHFHKQRSFLLFDLCQHLLQ